MQSRQGGLSKNEADELTELMKKRAADAPGAIQEVLPMLRAAARSEPGLSWGDRKIQLQRSSKPGDTRFGEGTAHFFSMRDQDGNPVGLLTITHDAIGQILHVEKVQAGTERTHF